MHRTRRDQSGYDGVAQTLHWLTLLLLVIQYGLAWSAPEHLSSPDSLVSLHLSFGLLVLIVAVARLVWRAFHPAPEPPSELPAWQRIGAHLVQILLYGLLIALPVLGWLWASARGWTVSLFGLVTLPAPVGQGSAIGHFAGDLHAVLCCWPWSACMLLGLCITPSSGATE
jgi:cytochrome b561